MSIPIIQFPTPNGVQQYEQYRQLSRIALDMQTAGWRVDKEALAIHREHAQARYGRFMQLFEHLTGVIDIGVDGGTQAVKDWFWVTKQAPKVSIDKKTKKPKLDINGALMHYLVEIEDEQLNKAAAALIGLRKAAKTISFCEEYDTPTGRVHPAFNVTGTKGSRWSSSGPNIQQLPSKEVKYDFGDGPELVACSLKNIMIADDGFVLVDADYAALELYLQTYLAGARKLVDCIATGRDLHLFNAQVLFGASRVPDEASKKTHKLEREVAKLGYGFSYNVTDHIGTTWKQMRGKMPELTERGCKEFRNRYFRAHPEFLDWQKRTVTMVEKGGFIDTPLMMRRLYLEPSTRGYNQAMNAQCQTTGGDLMNAAVLGVINDPQSHLMSHIRAQVHDSLVLQVPDTRAAVEEAGEILVRHMARPTQINGVLATFVVEPGVGKNWKDMIDINDWLKARAV